MAAPGRATASAVFLVHQKGRPRMHSVCATAGAAPQGIAPSILKSVSSAVSAPTSMTVLFFESLGIKSIPLVCRGNCGYMRKRERPPFPERGSSQSANPIVQKSTGLELQAVQTWEDVSEPKSFAANQKILKTSLLILAEGCFEGQAAGTRRCFTENCVRGARGLPKVGDVFTILQPSRCH